MKMEKARPYQMPTTTELARVVDDIGILKPILGKCSQEGCENIVEQDPALLELFGFPTCQPCIDNFVPAGRRVVTEEEILEKRWRTIAGADFVDSRVTHRDFPKALFERQISGWEPDGSGRGLLFLGDSGKCKTRSAMLLMRELILKRYDCHFVWRRDLRIVKQMIAQRRDFDLLNDWGSKGILFLDDFMKQGAADSAVTTFLDDLIDIRKSQKRPIVATTQLSSRDMIDSANQYGTATAADKYLTESFVRKLKDICQPIDFGRNTMEMEL